jgi:hypothetical protein
MWMCGCGSFSSGEVERWELHETEAYPVSLGSSPDQFGAESTMGKGERSRVETQAHNISGRQKENRGGTESTVGEGEEGSLKESRCLSH